MKEIFLILLLLIHPSKSLADDKNLIVKTYPKVCKDGWYYHPKNKDFAVYLYCGDAQGSHIAILNTENNKSYKKYTFNEIPSVFTWRENIIKTFGENLWLLKCGDDKDDCELEDWSNSINSFAWSNDGKYLYVSADYIYGTGNIYIVDLYNKKSYEVKSPVEPEDIPLNSSIEKVFDYGFLALFYNPQEYDEFYSFRLTKIIVIQDVIEENKEK